MNKKEIDKIYPLSSMQEGMLFHSLLDNNGTYFEQITIRLTGDFHVEQFEKSVQYIVDRYDIFRTIFIHQKVQKPRQVVLKQLAINVHHEDIRHLSVELAQQHIRRYAWEERKRGFSLSKDVLMRFAVFRTREDQYEIVWSYHHILMDGWCTSIVLGELFDVYRCFEQGLPVQLEKAMPYSQYIQWLKHWDKDEAQLYWNAYLSGYEQTATLPSRRPSAAGAAYENAELLLSLDKSSTEAFFELAKTFQVTSNCLFQALWGVLLQRYNLTDDVVFGAVVSGRPSKIAGIEKMVGLFINTVPVRVKANSSSSLASIARQLQEDSLLSERHAYLSLAEIQAGSPLQGNLLKTIVTYQNFGAASFDGTTSIGKDLPFVVQDVETFEQSNYDFNLMIVPNQELIFKFMFNKAVYDAPFMHRILSHFRNLLLQVADNPSIALWELNVTGASEISEQLEQLTQTRTAYGKERTLAELFEEQVRRNAGKAALVFKGRELSYGELNALANRAAHRLRERGVRANTIVGVLSDRSPEMIVSLLAVLKAGGAYLPIDPEYPEERIRYMLTDSGAAWVVSRRHLADRVKQDISLITIEEAVADDGSLDT
uniref:condensation domain-containing protein n=1 Tax=Paenibacillus algorifonticola TaxID=684063 RepID=UPI000AF6661F